MFKDFRWKKKYIVNNDQMCSMTDPCILTAPAFRLIEQDLKGAIQKVPTYICDVVRNSNFKEMLLNERNQSIKLTFIMNK